MDNVKQTLSKTLINLPTGIEMLQGECPRCKQKILPYGVFIHLRTSIAIPIKVFFVIKIPVNMHFEYCPGCGHLKFYQG